MTDKLSFSDSDHNFVTKDLTNKHSEQKHPHQIKVAGVEDVIASGGGLVHNPEVSGQVKVPWRTGQIETDCKNQTIRTSIQ